MTPNTAHMGPQTQQTVTKAPSSDLHGCRWPFAHQPLGSKNLAGTDHFGSHVPAWAGSAPRAMPPHKVLTNGRCWVHIDMRIRALFICAHPLHKHELLSMTPHPTESPMQHSWTGHWLLSMSSGSTAADLSLTAQQDGPCSPYEKDCYGPQLTWRKKVQTGMTSGHLLCCKGHATVLQLPSSHRWQTATLVGSCFSRHLPLAWASHRPVLQVYISTISHSMQLQMSCCAL